MAAARSTSSVGFAPIAEEGGAGDDAEARARISVILRVRPMSAAELSSESVPIIGVHGNRMSIVDPVTVQVTDRSVHSLASLPKRVFTYDHVMSTQTQAEVYAVAGAPLIEHAFSGYNCSVFAYGQTGRCVRTRGVGAPSLRYPRACTCVCGCVCVCTQRVPGALLF
ncbi:hypothetical protein EON67_08465 [archaeon]|nr:MAG: hypothetical protein EON67_08465 [archaeon]